jgi:hypothetical protein
MDDIVRAALKKWPHVPHCRGWLGLDARGDWYLREQATQAAGRFPLIKGSRIEHEALLGFISRNYACDDAGCWYFQNGPQRVYVELEAAPWVWRLQTRGEGIDVRSHTGLPAGQVHTAWVDEMGRLFLATELGLGLVHTLDMEVAAHAVEAGAWQPTPVRFEELPKRYGYVLSPAAVAQ